MHRRIYLLTLLLASILALYPGSARGDDTTDIMNKINLLRGVQPTLNAIEIEKLNTRMDEVWQFVESHKTAAVPILKKELSAALVRDKLDEFFVMDIGYLLYHIEGNDAESLSISALGKVDPESKIIKQNFKELFDFTHALAKSGHPRVLSQIDRIFLSANDSLEFWAAPHYVKLDARLICIFLYGITSPEVESYLAEKLKSAGPDNNRILEILGYLGSEQSVLRVVPILQHPADYETFSRALTMLMEVGGPAGRNAVIHLDPGALDARSKKYFLEILPEAKKGRTIPCLPLSSVWMARKKH